MRTPNHHPPKAGRSWESKILFLPHWFVWGLQSWAAAGMNPDAGSQTVPGQPAGTPGASPPAEDGQGKRNSSERKSWGRPRRAAHLPREPRVKSRRMDTLRSEGNWAWSDFSRVLSRQSTYPEENPERTEFKIQKDNYVLKSASVCQLTPHRPDTHAPSAFRSQRYKTSPPETAVVMATGRRRLMPLSSPGLTGEGPVGQACASHPHPAALGDAL